MLEGYNVDLTTQMKQLEDILMSSQMIQTCVKRASHLDIENYYIGAGCITQTVWNYLSNLPLDYGIKDIDFVYYDNDNLDYTLENEIVTKLKQLYSDLNIEIDVKNQARVHLWYEERFGYPIEPYPSLEAAINTWPTTATAIGIRMDHHNELKVYAPFGLNDLFGKIVRANKAQITKEIFEAKASKWQSKWPDLTVIPWA